MRRAYLKYARIASFGAMANRTVGPFEPGLNVVFGRNEAGKTTLSSFIDGVLFGWEEARGSRNTYKPDNAERAGSLFFAEFNTGEGDSAASAANARNADAACATARHAHASARGAETEFELSRIRNVDGLQGETALVDDIDRDTFRTMFSLTSDELRSLRNANDVTARLLTAGSGTGLSPALALGQVSDRLATYTSRAASAEHSLPRLTAEREELRVALQQLGDEMDGLKRLDAEFHQLHPQRAELTARVADANDDLESLAACRARVEKMDAELAQLASERLRLHREQDEAMAGLGGVLVGEGERSGEGERAGEDGAPAAATAPADATATAPASATVTASVSGSAADVPPATPTYSGKLIALYVVLGLLVTVFAASGAGMLMYGHGTADAAFTALGVALLVGALGSIAAVIALVVAMQRKARRIAEHAEQQERAQRQRAAQHRNTTEREAVLRQRVRASAEQLDELELRVMGLETQRANALERMGLPADASIDEIDFEIARRSRQRTELMTELEDLNARYGEMREKLAQAAGREDFADLKISYQAVRTRLLDATQEFMRLLLAKRLLERAIAEWELESQPEVYRQASRLLAIMTDGAWTRVTLATDGTLVVGNEAKVTRPAQKLSLGTCQQLYLSMRIALLMAADNVGSAVPVVADDILVNFDAERRRGAARALAELAQSRQVILLTCHEEVVEVLLDAQPAARVINL